MTSQQLLRRTREKLESINRDTAGLVPVEAALGYLRQFDRLKTAVPEALMQVVNDLAIQFAGPELPALLARIADAVERFPDKKFPGEAALLLELGKQAGSADIFLALLDKADSLPLNRPEVLREWFRRGMADTANNKAAALAYVSVESSRSTTLLDALEGRVRLADHRRVFELIAGAMTGRHIPVESVGWSADFRRGPVDDDHPPVFDGRVLRLPASVCLFNNRDDNVSFYRVSLFHQLGYMEFGCFHGIEKVRETIELHTDRRLAEMIFTLAEDARIDWLLAIRFPGIGSQIKRQKEKAASMRLSRHITRRGRLLEAMLCAGLDAPWRAEVSEHNRQDAARVRQAIRSLESADSRLADSLAVMQTCYAVIASPKAEETSDEVFDEQVILAEEIPAPVAWRGELDVAQVETTLRTEALQAEMQKQMQEQAETGKEPVPLPQGADFPEVKLGELTGGESEMGQRLFITGLEAGIVGEAMTGRTGQGEDLPTGVIPSRLREASQYLYDEWDHEINDYRPRWCRLHEHRELEEDEDYVHAVLLENAALARRVKHELGKVRPEVLRKVKGATEGEELDLERLVAHLVDRKAGLTPEESIYIQRRRKDRDVSTLFLLDMSASTDDLLPDPDAAPLEIRDTDDDEELAAFFARRREAEALAKRIIDLEKHAVVLMAEALEKLGDNYAVCGFSGYGREQVDYFLCKDFDEAYSAKVRGRIGGIRPCRSTRMGPPIRHGTRRLLETGARIKALIIISDGYPQDHDYGADRNAREYGLMDTMKALSEAKQQGVLTYCLTVDPSGHDYLRAMCPDSRYMVIQDIKQLPEELSRVYRGLTG